MTDRTRCAYCASPASFGFNKDHVIPKSLQRKCRQLGKPLPVELCGTVWACYPCNLRKGTRRLIPASWADKIDTLNDLIPGTPWRTWDGSTASPAFREVHI